MGNANGLEISCPCGRTHSANEWLKLPLVGVISDGDGGHLELRNCACGSTRALVVAEPTPEPWIDQCSRCQTVTDVEPLGDEPACSMCVALASGVFEGAVAA